MMLGSVSSRAVAYGIVTVSYVDILALEAARSMHELSLGRMGVADDVSSCAICFSLGGLT